MDTLQRLEFYPVRATEITPTDLLTLADAKAHLRVDHDTEDDLITALIGSAISTAEKFTGRLFGSTAATLYADAWASQAFTFGPVTAISAVKYYDQANTLQTLSGSQYWTDLKSDPQRITFNAPPAIYSDRHQGVEITATVGHATLPAPVKSAALLLVAHYYENRQAVVQDRKPEGLPLGVEFLLNPYRLWP